MVKVNLIHKMAPIEWTGPIRDPLGASNVLNLCKEVFLEKLIIIRLVKISPKFIALF